METAHIYNVDIEWLQDRKGVASSPELDNTVEVVTPPEFPKGIARVWSPEHFFVAAVNSCLMTTFLAVAENSKLNYISFKSQATGTLEKVEGKFMITKVLLKPHVVLAEGETPERAQKVLTMSEKACLISNSIKSEVVMDATVTFA